MPLFRFDRIAGALFVRRMRIAIPYVLLAILPGSVLTLPVLIWWRHHRRTRRPGPVDAGAGGEAPRA